MVWNIQSCFLTRKEKDFTIYKGSLKSGGSRKIPSFRASSGGLVWLMQPKLALGDLHLSFLLNVVGTYNFPQVHKISQKWWVSSSSGKFCYTRLHLSWLEWSLLPALKQLRCCAGFCEKLWGHTTRRSGQKLGAALTNNQQEEGHRSPAIARRCALLTAMWAWNRNAAWLTSVSGTLTRGPSLAHQAWPIEIVRSEMCLVLSP